MGVSESGGGDSGEDSVCSESVEPVLVLLSNSYSNDDEISASDSRDSFYPVSQTSFSLYFHIQWTDFHKLSCARKPQISAIHTYTECTKATTND